MRASDAMAAAKVRTGNSLLLMTITRALLDQEKTFEGLVKRKRARPCPSPVGTTRPQRRPNPPLKGKCEEETITHGDRHTAFFPVTK
jgi:hypothetical protein